MHDLHKSNGKRHEEIPEEHHDPLIQSLHLVIRNSVRFLAVLMTLVICWGVGDVIYVLYNRLMAPPVFLLSITDILQTFSAFLAVLIAIEIFQNITLYIRKDVYPIKLVVATALMAVARKVIVFDFSEIEPLYVFGTGAVVLALGITYFLLSKNEQRTEETLEKEN